MGDETDKAGAAGQAGAGGKSSAPPAAKPEDKAGLPESIPHNRFHAVNEELKETKAKAQTLESQVAQYEAVFSDPRVQAALKAPQATPKPQGQQIPTSSDDDEYDPFDKSSVAKVIDRRVKESLDAVLSQHVAPIRDIVQRQLWNSQEEQAVSLPGFGGRQAYEKDKAAIIRKIQTIPGLTVPEAWTLIRAERNGIDGSHAGSDGVGTHARGSARPGGDSDGGPETMTAEEQVVAKNFDMTPDEYMKWKKVAEESRGGPARQTTSV